MDDSDRWAALDSDARRAVARSLAGDGLVFDGLDDRRAHFEADGRRFVLVPGARIELGWAPGPLALTDAQRRAWQEGLTALWGLEDPPEALVAENLSPPRRVQVPSLLVQVTPDEVDLDDILYDDDGDERAGEPFALIGAALAGFRLPTGDEWEALYRGGASTLFPWGDAWPDVPPYGAAAPSLPEHPYGLQFNADPYWTELVAGALRGGDGGTDLCGGVPNPVAWRSLACAFVPPAELWVDLLEESLECGLLRRVRAVELR